MLPTNLKPVTPQEFADQTQRDLIKLLKQHDPIWSAKFKNFVRIQEAAAFSYGFIIGAILAIMLVLLFILILRSR